MSVEYRWTWREALRIWRYNNIKRPWNAFRWWQWTTFYQEGRQFARDLPGAAKLRPGRIQRKDMEWAMNACDQIKDLPLP